MIESSKIRKYLIQEAYLNYCNDLNKFKQVSTYITKMTFQELENFDNKYNIQKRNQILQESAMGALSSLMGIIFFTPIWVSYRTIKAFHSKCVRRCNIFGVQTDKRKKCLLDCELIQVQKALALARQAQSKCSDSKSPTLCEYKTRKVIKKISDEVINIKLKQSAIQKNMT